MICVHCGEALGGTLDAGLFVHESGLQRCQAADVPYGHMGHPRMPCPTGVVNGCIGEHEEFCEHFTVCDSKYLAGFDVALDCTKAVGHELPHMDYYGEEWD